MVRWPSPGPLENDRFDATPNYRQDCSNDPASRRKAWAAPPAQQNNRPLTVAELPNRLRHASFQSPLTGPSDGLPRHQVDF